MITLAIDISNDGVEAAKYEIRAFLRYEDKKMAGDLADTRDTAALGYVTLRRFLTAIEDAEKGQALARAHARQEEQKRADRMAPSIRRERRG